LDPLLFRALKTLEHFSSLLRLKALLWCRLKFKANFKSLVWSFSSKVVYTHTFLTVLSTRTETTFKLKMPYVSLFRYAYLT
jgi:hypothetical protein